MMMKLGFTQGKRKPCISTTRNEIFELSFTEMISLQLEALKVSSGSMKLLAKNGWLLSVLSWDHQERRILSKTKMKAYGGNQILVMRT